MDIRPCPENDGVYGAQSIDDPDIVELIKSIRIKGGLIEPIHISADGFIISGHRRRFCAFQAGLSKVDAIRHAISYKDDREEFLRLLVEANTQRKKTAAMLIRETAMKIDPVQAEEDFRQEQQDVEDERRFGSNIGEHLLQARNLSSRKQISAAKMPMLAAAIRVIEENEDFWPLSVRQVHYRLLGADAPLRHASKPGSRYTNCASDYNDLTDLLARARVEGRVEWEAIDDETRPEALHNHFWNAAEFSGDQIERFLRGYTRNKQQSQRDHIEVIAEKLTVKTILESVCRRYSLPLTISRGQNGPTVKRKIAERYWQSGKGNLILLVVSDLDPSGETIAQNFCDDLTADFDIAERYIEVYRAGLNIKRVHGLGLTPSMEAKESSKTFKAFFDKYGIRDAYELEAMTPKQLQDALIEDIEGVMDMDAMRAERKAEAEDFHGIKAMKMAVVEFLKTAKGSGQ